MLPSADVSAFFSLNLAGYTAVCLDNVDSKGLTTLSEVCFRNNHFGNKHNNVD